MMLTEHQVNPLNHRLLIHVLDHPNNAGAHCRYDVTGFDTDTNPSSINSSGYKTSFSRLCLVFQNGNPNDPAVGANGITHEVLLAILADRLRGFQSGPFAHERNAKALEHIEAAMAELNARTAERIERGVEGQRVE